MNIPECSTILSTEDRWDHLQARVGYSRMEHRVVPGLYRVGSPSRRSPVLVTANYTLSFDALRTSLRGIDAYILVLDTFGVNVWCAAGKGTFGTAELVSKVRSTGVSDLVEKGRLILPQLGAPGVSAHEVARETGFTVEYGPVQASDIPEYLRTGTATPEMRTVRFTLRDRATLAPVELVNTLPYLMVAMVLLFLIGGTIPVLMAMVAILGGTVLFPLLLPVLPTKEFSSKGLVMGAILSLPFIYVQATGDSSEPLWTTVAYALGIAMIFAAVVGYLGLNFTGSSTYASRTGVRKEIFRWIPVMVASLTVGSVLMILSLGSQQGWY